MAKTAIINNNQAYIYLSNKLKENEHIIDLVIKYNKYNYNISDFVDVSLLTKDLIIKILNNTPISTDFITRVPKTLLTDKIVTKIIDKDPLSIFKISPESLNDDIILTMIKNDDLKFLKSYLEKNNIQITDVLLIIKALKINQKYIDYISKELLNDKLFVMKILDINGNFILKISTKLQHDRDIIICAINNSKDLVKYNHILLYNQVWNIQWNFKKFEKNYIDILENMQYMPFTENIGLLLDDIFSYVELKDIILDKYKHYLTNIISYNNDKNEEYILLFEKYNIRFLNFNDVKPLDSNETEEEIKKAYENENKNKIILWY